jgi:anthranilate phosphoribosyltransferase
MQGVRYHGRVGEKEFRELTRQVVEQGRTLQREETRALLGAVLSGSLPSYETDELPESFALLLAGLLGAMAQRGETAEELCGIAEAMRAAATPVPLTETERERLVDTCGTGGDGLDTLNISTAAGLVAAGAGVWVAKHGNRAVTSRCGSADVLEALGVPIHLAPETAAECLRETGFLFMLAPLLHPAMRRVGPLRRALPFRTVFNLAGPLTNPAGARAQVVGVYAEERVPVVAEALRLLGTRHAWVVHGRVDEVDRGLDELTVTGQSVWTAVQGNATYPGVLWPESLGLRVAKLAELAGAATAAENAGIVEAVLRGTERSARREIVLLNAAAALVVSGTAPTLVEGLERATESVDSGSAFAVVERLRRFGAAHPA